MRQLGIGPNYLAWIKFIYRAPRASGLTNGLQSARFILTRGMAQGSPVSLLLFALAIEHLAMAIRQNPQIRGVTVDTKKYKILLYADDVLLTLTEQIKSLPVVIQCVREANIWL